MKKNLYVMIVALTVSVSVHGFGARESGPAQSAGPTVMFTDSTGRQVELPRNIERVAPSGPLAQIVLYTLAPDKMVGLSGGLGEEQFAYMDSSMRRLPVLGGYSQGTLNLESLLVANPQIFIDIGEFQNDSLGDMDAIQNATGIPAIFVQMDSLESMITAYETLGRLLGSEAQARRLGDYIRETIDTFVNNAAGIKRNRQVSIFYGQADGLTAVVDGTVHSDVIDFAGARNVTQIPQNMRGGVADISMEQLLLWDPDVVLFAPGSIYTTVHNRVEWSQVRAIREGRFYEIPAGPYNWMGRPPSVNRVIGIRWLANLLYPDTVRIDMAREARDFYRLFYHHELAEAQIQSLLANSTFKK
jgi:iron complex transport system substrate-binding protein